MFKIQKGVNITLVQMAKKTVYGRCPKCKAKSDLIVMSGTPGKEKFKCNQCYHVFGMDEL
jgi:transposase-like protein